MRMRRIATRCPFNLQYPECGLKCAEDIEELIQTETSGRDRGVLRETVHRRRRVHRSAAGVFREGGGDRAEVWRAVHQRWKCRRRGSHGRSHVRHLALEGDAGHPDSAKGMGNGAPIGLTIATPEVADKYPGVTFATFGGNPVSCAARMR
jgi:4-aminobutyrate aminotransferase